MNVGLLILAFWIAVAAAYLIWQFATGALAAEDRGAVEPRPAAGGKSMALPHARQPEFDDRLQPIPMPVLTRDRVASLHRRKRVRRGA